MSIEYNLNEPFTVKHWETYKVLNKIKETIHHKRKLIKEKYVYYGISIMVLELFYKKRNYYLLNFYFSNSFDEGNQYSNKASIEKRIEQSNRELYELLRDGNELITNVGIANDRREIKNRTHVLRERFDLINKLRDESKLDNTKLENIVALWHEFEEYKDPISLNNGLETLKLHIRDLLAQKDEVIGKLHDALGRADERYVFNQFCKEEDVQCLIERINMQVEVMKEAYQNHLALLHQSIDEERVSFKQSHTNKWLSLHDLREECEQQNLENISDRRKAYDDIAFKVQLEHDEKCRTTRIQLDRDNEQLKIELQNINAETILNTEKLNYNHHVLQKRAEEDVCIRHQQKQRLVRMASVISAIRNRMERIKHENSEDIRKNSQDVTKLYENVKNLRQKSDILTDSNDQKVPNLSKRISQITVQKRLIIIFT